MGVLDKVKPHHLERTYQLKGWTNHVEFLELLARKTGRLLKAGEPDLDGVAKMVLNDFMRGKIPWYTPAPVEEGEKEGNFEGRGGKLGEIPLKRKRDAEEATGGEKGEEEFEGFGPDKEEKTDESVADSDANDDEKDDGVSLASVSDGDLDSEEGDDESDGDDAGSTSTGLKTSVASRSEKSSGAKRRKT